MAYCDDLDAESLHRLLSTSPRVYEQARFAAGTTYVCFYRAADGFVSTGHGRHCTRFLLAEPEQARPVCREDFEKDKVADQWREHPSEAMRNPSEKEWYTTAYFAGQARAEAPMMTDRPTMTLSCCFHAVQILLCQLPDDTCHSWACDCLMQGCFVMPVISK